MRSLGLTFACAILVSAIGCRSHTSPPVSPAHDDTVVTRVYDVRDLIVNIPNFVPDETGRHAATQPTRTPDEMAHELIATITSSIDPQSWRENAGPCGIISELKGQLIVTQTPTNQLRIIEKLKQMRDENAIQITFEARFITSSEFEKLLTGGKKYWSALNDRNAELWPMLLCEDKVRELTRSVQQSADTTLVAAPRITMFNGQRAYVVVSRQTAYVSDLHKAGNEIKPDIGIIDSGVLVDCQAKVTQDRKFVTLTIRPRMTTLLGINPAPWPGGEGQLIQVPETLTSGVSTTITMPDQQTAVYKLRAQHSPTTRPVKDAPVFLLVRPKIISQREVAGKPQPLLDRGG